jgi:hypothetical protein
MKKQKQNKIQRLTLGIVGGIFLLNFLFLHSPLNIFAGLFLSDSAPHLKAIPLLEIGLPRDVDGIPTYRSPLHLEGHYDKDPYIDTIFAKDFTPKKFDHIEPGMTQKQVLELLGEPLSHDAFGFRNQENANLILPPNDPRTEECWRYSSDGKLAQSGDASWYSFIICFKDDILSEKQANEFHD